jgi:hypothetical protein
MTAILSTSSVSRFTSRLLRLGRIVPLLLAVGLASCARTSPQPEIAAGQRRCVIFHPYYYNSEKRPGEITMRTALRVRVGGGETYTLRPYRSLQVPIPRSGTVIEVLDDPLERVGSGRRTESATIPAGNDVAYVRVGRTQQIAGVTGTPGSGIPVAVPAWVYDRAERVKPEVARKELAEFE